MHTEMDLMGLKSSSSCYVWMLAAGIAFFEVLDACDLRCEHQCLVLILWLVEHASEPRQRRDETTMESCCRHVTHAA